MKTLPFLEEEIVKQLPLNYRYIKKLEVALTTELKQGKRFSISNFHYSGQYLTAETYKPISNIFISDLIKKHEDDF
ncbi:hypothetical protein H7F33_17530 [Pedobacter sp. PAMC26386]|nr:hypothetical protein H7F33_17530 [Pedobacter sp. PAMC26386]